MYRMEGTHSKESITIDVALNRSPGCSEYQLLPDVVVPFMQYRELDSSLKWIT
jgi:hypothetical protein